MSRNICSICGVDYTTQYNGHFCAGRGHQNGVWPPFHPNSPIFNKDDLSGNINKISELENRISELEKIVQGLKSVEEMRWRSYANARGKIFINDKECIEAAEKYIENFKGDKNV